MGPEIEDRARPRRSPGWDALRRGLRVAVIGADRPLGRELTALLLAAGHPASGLALRGERPAKLSWRGAELAVEPPERSLAGVHLAFLAAAPGDGPSGVLDRLLETDCRVLDCTGRGVDQEGAVLLDGTSRMAPGLFARLLVLPSPRLQALVRLLRPLAGGGALRALELTSFLAGQDGPGERGLGAGAVPAAVTAGWEAGLRRHLAEPGLALAVDPWPGLAPRSDLHLVRAELAEPPDLERLRSLWAGEAPGVRLVGKEGPDLEGLGGTAEVHVGRIRAGSGAAPSLCFCAASDPLRLAANTALAVAASLPAVS